MWFFGRHRVGDNTTNVFLALRIRGALDSAALLRALRRLVGMHEALRTTLVSERARLTQVVHDSSPLPAGVLDRVDTAEAELGGLLDREFRHEFDLAEQWPIRMRLFRLSPEDHALVLNIHHLAVDGWSVGVLLEDLQLLYRVETGAAGAPPEPPAWQYADFCAWQRQRQEDGVLQPHVDYWTRHLDGARPVDLAPVLRAEAAAGDPGLLRFGFAPDTVAAIRAVAKRARVTSFAAVLAALCVTLSARLGSTDIVLPSMFANRLDPRLRRTVGYVANSVLLRVDMSGEPAFDEVARRCLSTIAGAMSHQEVPYQAVPFSSGDAGRRVPTCLLEYQHESGRPVELPGATVEMIKPDTASTSLHLMLHLSEFPDDLVATCLYDTGAGSMAAVRALLDQVAATIDAAGAPLAHPAGNSAG